MPYAVVLLDSVFGFFVFRDGKRNTNPHRLGVGVGNQDKV